MNLSNILQNVFHGGSNELFVYGSNFSPLNTEASYINRPKIYASYKVCVFT